MVLHHWVWYNTKIKSIKIQNLLLFYGQQFGLQLLDINVLNYCYFHNCLTFLNKKTLGK